ncbi:MAG: hypothetical protein LBQ05_00225 [Christensenellaceae bacterium]|jgi:Na+-driven multidrug efflux pump|nr:hypothetical protein [Christensenellaceae bacterium]
MSSVRSKKLIKYVLPTIFSSVCFFLFTIIDGIFVGNGVGVEALGAFNILMPFVMTVYAVNMIVTVGGATIASIRSGRGDKKGANWAFFFKNFAAMTEPLRS